MINELETKYKILKTVFGFSEFRKGQAEIIDSVLSRRDTIAVMPTGSGKSLCFQIPAFACPGVVVVISPLIALMQDQVETLRKRGIPAGALFSGQEQNAKREIFAEIRKSTSYLLYLSPERVQKPGFAQWLTTVPISLFAIDEAHCVSQWGPDFRQDYYRLAILRKLSPLTPILALTASATPAVIGDIATKLSLQDPQRLVYGFYRPNLFYQTQFCDDEQEKLNLLHDAIQKFPDGKIIIYCGTRKNCELVSTQLAKFFPKIDHYHAGLSSEERTSIQSRFSNGEIRILTATNAFGLGINIPDVRLVAHFQLPATIDSYYQEVGRAGRDGEDSSCLLLYSKKDRGLHAYFIQNSDAPDAIVQRRWRALDTMIQFAEGGECRNSGILTYFRDSQRKDSCGHCDVCTPNSTRMVRPGPAVFKSKISTRRRKKQRKRKDSKIEIGPMTAEALERVELLREFRKEFAKSREIPAFLVFSNKSLEDIAQRNPSSLAELEKAHGMGAKKIAVLGKEILATLSNSR